MVRFSILFEQAERERFERERRGGVDERGTARGLGEHAPDGDVRLVIVEGDLPAEDLVEDDPERIDVGAVVDRDPLRLFGRHAPAYRAPCPSASPTPFCRPRTLVTPTME